MKMNVNADNYPNRSLEEFQVVRLACSRTFQKDVLYKIACRMETLKQVIIKWKKNDNSLKVVPSVDTAVVFCSL